MTTPHEALEKTRRTLDKLRHYRAGNDHYGFYYNFYNREDVIESLALLSIIEGAMVPEGFVTVPLEPTKDMKEAGRLAAVDSCLNNLTGHICWKNDKGETVYFACPETLIYKAMIAAAPQIKKEKP